MRLLELHIECADLQRSVELYRLLLEPAEVLWDGLNDPQAFLVLKDNTAFGLWQRGTRGILEGRGGAHLHFAFQIAPEEYDDYKNRIQSANLEALEWDWPDGSRSVYFFDPDGHQGEFMTREWPIKQGSGPPN